VNTDSSIDPFWILYLVNVEQPVSQQTLEAEAAKLLMSTPNRTEPIDVPKCLADLLKFDLIILRSDKLYSVTSLGLERLSKFKFGRIRDKNRLFLLKKRFETMLD
jgi:hypothetical protein